MDLFTMLLEAETFMGLVNNWTCFFFHIWINNVKKKNILGGPYANFAGHDASRGLAKNSFDGDMLTDPKEAIDKLEDLTTEEWESLREWEQHFATKYLFVGKLVENQ